MQPLSLAALAQALSQARLDAYRQPTDTGDVDMIARYMWNVALSCALHPSLHALEVTFRNVLYSASVKVLAKRPMVFADIPCWLDARPSLLLPRQAEAVEEAKERLRRRGGSGYMTPDRLVAKLSFGFWTALCNSAYEQTRASGPGLWPGILKYSFVFAPKRHRNRPDILRRVDEIRELRNRVSHHEPIWEWDLPAWNARILETLSWMNGAIAEATRRRSRLEAVFAAGPEAYRPDAEELIGGGAAPGVARPGA